jgi:hypothetical protein
MVNAELFHAAYAGLVQVPGREAAVDLQADPGRVATFTSLRWVRRTVR